MKLPLQVSFRNLGSSEAIRAAIAEHARKLDRFFDRIMACRVVVEAPHKHRRRGHLYHVRLDITVPGDEIVVGREHAENQAHQDLYVALHDAFDEARRKLQDHARHHREWKKVRVGPPQGRIARLFKDDGYGFLETADGREVYFHRNSVLNDAFDRLRVGAMVRFAEAKGRKGPQASTVEALSSPGGRTRRAVP
jgi:ribosomal subunit interface protein